MPDQPDATPLSDHAIISRCRRPRSRAAIAGCGRSTRNHHHTHREADAICLAPQYVAEELLGAEGFTEIQYVELSPTDIPQAIGRGEADFSTNLAGELIQAIDAGVPVVGLAGVHVGCFELFAKQSILRITELKGKRVAADDPMLFKLMAAHVGLDPAKDIDWVLSTDSACRPAGAVCGGEDRRLPGLSAGSRRNCAPDRSDT